MDAPQTKDTNRMARVEKGNRMTVFKFASIVAIAGWISAAYASDMVIASVAPLSGPLAFNGVQNLEGSRACIDEANAAGGVHGHKLRLVAVDDQYKAQETVRLVRLVAERNKPIAFLNLIGSENVSALLRERTLVNVRIPVVGVSPGADILRKPGSPWIFHVQASDGAQLKRIVSHLATIGLTRIAVAYQDSPFGQDGLKTVESFAAEINVAVTGRIPIAQGLEDLKQVAGQLRRTEAQAYVMIVAPDTGTLFVRDVLSSGDTTPICGMSYISVQGAIEKAGLSAATGLALAQVTPNVQSSNTALVRRFQAAMGKYSEVRAPGQHHLMGYVSCQVVLEGLRNSGPAPKPERFLSAMRRTKIDIGGYLSHPVRSYGRL